MGETPLCSELVPTEEGTEEVVSLLAVCGKLNTTYNRLLLSLGSLPTPVTPPRSRSMRSVLHRSRKLTCPCLESLMRNLGRRTKVATRSGSANCN